MQVCVGVKLGSDFEDGLTVIQKREIIQKRFYYPESGLDDVEMDQPTLEVPDDNLKKLPVRFISDVYAGDHADQHTKDQPITVRF